MPTLLMRDKHGNPIRTYGRPPAMGLVAILLVYLVVLALIIWGLFEINSLLFLWR